MAGKRIAVVGGGSQFSVGLCESLIDYARDRLPGLSVSLLDINAEHLKIVYQYADRLAKAVGVDVRFEATTDRKRAFDGADFILNTFRPGSHLQQEQDESVPPKYGLQGNETVSIGGIFMACRVVPVLQGICADAEEMCPNAWFVNYTNPTQYVADAVRRISKMRIISLCDGFVEDAEMLARLLNVEPDDITIFPGGSNHGMWILRFTVKGEDGYPLLKERNSRITQKEIEELFPMPSEYDFIGVKVKASESYKQFITNNGFPFTLKLYQVFGLLPSPRYYTHYHYDQDAVITDQMSGHYVTMARFYIDKIAPRIFTDLDRRFEHTSTHLMTERRKGGGGHGDLATRVVDAMVNNTGEIFDVKVPNRGAVSNLPYESIVEVAAAVDRSGPHPFGVGALPKAVLGYQYALVLAQELAIDAALSGSRNDLLQAILAHPLVHSVSATEKAMDELLALQKEWLPQFTK